MDFSYELYKNKRRSEVRSIESAIDWVVELEFSEGEDREFIEEIIESSYSETILKGSIVFKVGLENESESGYIYIKDEYIYYYLFDPALSKINTVSILWPRNQKDTLFPKGNVKVR